jgi:hypothetical protein
MKLLPDENLPKRLKSDLINHEVYTRAEMNWAGVTNGKLLELLVANSVDALLTFDKNLQYQQNFKRYSMSVLVLSASDNRYQTLKPLMEKVKQLLVGNLSPGPIEVNLQ